MTYTNLLIRDNGFSLDAKHETPKGGYMVAVKGFEGVFSIENIKEIESYCKELRSKLKDNQYVGGWLNTENGKAYIDVSENIMSKEQAIFEGRARKEIAIWDVLAFDEIRLN